MKLSLLSLLVLTSLCFVLGDEDDIQPNFDDLVANDGQIVEDTPDDYAEDEEDSYMEDDEDFLPEDDDDANQTGGKKVSPGVGKPPVDSIVDPTRPSKGEEEGSGIELNNSVDSTVEPTRPSEGEEEGSGIELNKSDEPDDIDALKNKLGLNSDSDDPEFNKK